MATIVKGTTFTNAATAGGMHALVENATISGIDRLNMDADAVVVATKSASEPLSPTDRETWQTSPTSEIVSYNSSGSKWIPATVNVVRYKYVQGAAGSVVAGSLLEVGGTIYGTLASPELSLANGPSHMSCAIALHPVSDGNFGLAVVYGPAKAVCTGTINAGESVKASATVGAVQSAGAAGTGGGLNTIGTAIGPSSGGFVWINLRR